MSCTQKKKDISMSQALRIYYICMKWVWTTNISPVYGKRKWIFNQSQKHVTYKLVELYFRVLGKDYYQQSLINMFY